MSEKAVPAKEVVTVTDLGSGNGSDSDDGVEAGGVGLHKKQRAANDQRWPTTRWRMAEASVEAQACSSPGWRQMCHFNVTCVFQLPSYFLAAPSRPTLPPALGLLKASRFSSVLAVNRR